MSPSFHLPQRHELRISEVCLEVPCYLATGTCMLWSGCWWTTGRTVLQSAPVQVIKSNKYSIDPLHDPILSLALFVGCHPQNKQPSPCFSSDIKMKLLVSGRTNLRVSQPDWWWLVPVFLIDCDIQSSSYFFHVFNLYIALSCSVLRQIVLVTTDLASTFTVQNSTEVFDF